MEAIKAQKLEKLKIEAEQNGERANGFEAEVKELKAVIAKQETEIQGLNNKVALLTADLERAEKRADDSTAAHHERKAKQLETEKAELEKKHDELTVVHTALKSEFEETLKSLEAL
ncbi:hypothetical protein HK100_012135 [Physocladia obscura]|uniref:Tropomyosin n=1 Tax=Physocladia obscura TaxID=109957 RepID=A0AAD5T1Y5_9FUNG|nr:hypothetical protein HK100_012135 [Physocladia obscura]